MGASLERKFRRFELEYLAYVIFPWQGLMIEATAVTKNISLCGLLLESACSIPCCTPLEFTITVQGKLIVQPVILTGSGVVVRVKADETSGKFTIAVECSLPISQTEQSPTQEDPALARCQIRADC